MKKSIKLTSLAIALAALVSSCGHKSSGSSDGKDTLKTDSSTVVTDTTKKDTSVKDSGAGKKDTTVKTEVKKTETKKQ